MKLVTKFLTTSAEIYFYAGKFVVTTKQKIVFSSSSYEMCVGVAINRQELAVLTSNVIEYYTQLTAEIAYENV